MCNFFSCISNGKGKIRYFDKDIRQQIRDGKLSYSEDSHDSLCSYFRGDIPMDRANKYEYNPISGEFTVDQINAVDDSGFNLDDRTQVEKFCHKLDFNTVVPDWSYVADILKRLKTYKPINPITITKMPDEKKLRDVLARVRDSVRDSVGDSVGNSVWASVWDSVWDSVRASVWASVWASVRDSVRDSVGNSVGNSVGEQAYICGYHAINKFMRLGIKHPAFELVDMGVVVVSIKGMVKVYGKAGKFLGEFKE